ncbi:hypothetical protein IAR55_001067 [Kwoniella newhampshirensis]|uniref:Uncharacterized protein n=1 Tax=Kwoniella newhampshirensis TaxID=1651941 RepID=A0AAW0Z4R9_9TREE
MISRNKRPTTFNPAHTHPASISSVPSIQSKVHISTTNGSGFIPDEAAQSGGGGGGGVGAGSEAGMEVVVDKQGNQAGKKDGGPETTEKWGDVKKVHPAWEGFGKRPGGKEEGDKAKL